MAVPFGQARIVVQPNPRNEVPARSPAGRAAPVAPEILIMLPAARAASSRSRQWLSRWLLVAVTT